MAPIFCKALSSKEDILSLGWSITSLASLLAFTTTGVLSFMSFHKYNELAIMYGYYPYYNNNYYNGDEDGKDREDGEGAIYHALGNVGSFGVLFAGIYLFVIAAVISAFGARYVVGFITPFGGFVRPSKVEPMTLGIFFGGIVLFTNLCLVSAVVLGDFHIVNYFEERQKEEFGSFAIENMSALLGTMSMFLAVLFFLYSILLFSLKEALLKPEEGDKVGSLYKAPTEPSTVIA